jgi:hypothetical protein
MEAAGEFALFDGDFYSLDNGAVGTNTYPWSEVVATNHRTATGTASSIASGTPTTVFSTTAAGRYEVVAYLSGANAALYTAFATVLSDGVNQRIVANNGVSLTLTLSGANVQVTQSSGGNESVQWAYLKIR